ncbi:MAG: hypothetical protein IPL35_09835 [Sphingobacteriales bacterium]|nr:hypothetical protein [Sphingobacteriales bacterium]
MPYWSGGLNERYRNIAAPFRPYPCVCGDDCHITDSKIEFVLQDIYFHEDPVNHHAKSFNFPQYHVNIEHEINIYFTGNLPTGGGVGGAAELGGVVDQSGLNFSDDDELGLYLVNCFQPNTDPNTLSVIIGRQLAHELGHNLGLLHTYQATCCPEICNTQSLEYLDDVFGAGTTECPQNCHHPHIWNCGTPNNDFTDPQNGTNNMMSDANSSRYLSPEQIARVHRNTYLFSVKDYIFNCPKSAVPWEITENETWDFPIRMYEDIVVKSGATLTLQCEVRMPAEARIIVERGARLVVDGATITSACAGQRWQGIEVWGNPAVAHTAAMLNAANALAADGPGVVQFSNDALIENAICAVSTTRRNYASPQEYYGGIVQAQECTFLNNRKSVEMLRYTLANVSAFTDCIFECTDSQTHTGVSLWAVSNIPFKGCTFTNLQQYGITGLDASFMVARCVQFFGRRAMVFTRVVVY